MLLSSCPGRELGPAMVVACTCHPLHPAPPRGLSLHGYADELASPGGALSFAYAEQYAFGSASLVCRGCDDELVSRQRDAREFISPWLTAKAAGPEVGTADTLRHLREQDAGLLADQQERALKRLLSQGWQLCFEAHVGLKGIYFLHGCGTCLPWDKSAVQAAPFKRLQSQGLQVCYRAWHGTEGS